MTEPRLWDGHGLSGWVCRCDLGKKTKEGAQQLTTTISVPFLSIPFHFQSFEQYMKMVLSLSLFSFGYTLSLNFSSSFIANSF
jgi:hypothetical protein